MTKNNTISANAEWGPNDPEVETIWVLFKDAIKQVEYEQLIDEADFRADRIYEKLNEARNHYITINKKDFNARPSSERVAVYNSLYSCLWSAYKDRFTKLATSLGYNVGCIFAGDDYEEQMGGMIKKYPELADIKAFIDAQKEQWQDNLRDNRNGNEHDGDFRTKTEVPAFYDKESAKNIFTLVCYSIESLGMKFLSYKLPDYLIVVPVNKGASVFDRVHRFEIRHAVQGSSPTPLFETPYH